MAKMQELIAAGLFGKGLICIDVPHLVRRYNECLIDMGLEPTTLTSFHIDRMGWSPEIAAEKKNDYYLSHGDANPLVIIIVPLQERAPIYFPMHSFDWRLMDEWFGVHRKQVIDLTKETGLWLDIDQEVDLYAEPRDLLMVTEIIIKVRAPNGLIERAREQSLLVRKFLANESSHRDDTLLAALEESARESGDLRMRHLVMKNTLFSNVTDFYSRAFGGTFVLRSKNRVPLLFVREAKRADNERVFLADETIVPTLEEHGYVSKDASWWSSHLFYLKIVAESFLMEVLDEVEPETEFLSLGSAKQKALIVKHQEKLKTYLDLLRVVKTLETGSGTVETPVYLEHFLLHPSRDLEKVSREVVEQLLTYVNGGRNVILFYRHQKTAFVEAYTKRWKSPRREWARVRIREHYEYASKAAGHKT